MKKKLSEWAAENGILYNTAYKRFKKGNLEINAKKDSGGNIYVYDNKPEITASTRNPDIKQTITFEDLINQSGDEKYKALPTSVSFEISAATSTRTNKSATIQPLDRFANIDSGFIPWTNSTGIQNTSNLSIKDVVILCWKAYFNFSIVRNVIDLMGEFSTNDIYFRGGNKKVRDFFTAYFKKINLAEFQDQFFREYYRSGNVFIYPLNASLKKGDIAKFNQVFGSEITAAKLEIPAKYIILNSADIICGGSSSFVNPVYYKILNGYELERLRNPKTEEDQEILDNLDIETRDAIKNKKSNSVTIKLDPAKTYAVFYKKQNFEPFAVSLIFPVLDDLEWKSELKKMDRALARTCQQVILLITMGYENKAGEFMYNQKIADALKKIFENESIGRVLISDFTTKADFVIPKIAEILDPKKYQQVENDIKNGLNDILFGGTSSEKFANQSIKVKVFVERLNQSRQIFLNSFLIPEIKRISKLLGFKNYPEPVFAEIDLRDKETWANIYTRLLEIGAITPFEAFEGIETGRIPTKEESVENQTEFREMKDKGLFEPLVQPGAYTQKLLQDNQLKVQERLAEKSEENKLKAASLKIKTMPAKNGRPPMSKRKQSTKKISPMKASLNEENSESQFSFTQIQNNLLLAIKITEITKEKLVKKHGLKKLNKDQESIAEEIAQLIIINELPEKWEISIDKYIEKPIDTNVERVKEIDALAHKFQVEYFLAGILYNSKIE